MADTEERKHWDNLSLGYTESKGSSLLRAAIQKHYSQIKLDEILVSSPGELSFSLMNSILQKGDEIICVFPCYQSLYEVANSIGCKVSFWQAEFTDDGWWFDPAKLEKMMHPGVKLLVINFPHNPTGYVPDRKEYERIIQIAEDNGTFLFSDEMYRFLVDDKQYALPSASDLCENALSLWGVSKTFGLAGLRIGWATSKNHKILQKMESFKDYLSICSSAPSEILTSIALNHADLLIKKNVKKIQSNKALFQSFVNAHDLFENYQSTRGGSTAFVKLILNERAIEFTERLVKNTGIMLLPSESFSMSDPYVRIGFGRENFSEVLSKLSHFLEHDQV